MEEQEEFAFSGGSGSRRGGRKPPRRGAKSGKRKSGKAQPPKRRSAGGRGSDASEMARKQRDISVSEFFAKNRHLLGFDNPSKALLTTVKEGRGQRARRLRGGRDPAGRPRGDRAARRDALPRRHPGQRPRHRQEPGAEDLRTPPLRLEVPSAAPEPGTAGDRHQRRRDVRTAHHGQAGRHHHADERQEARSPLRAGDRHAQQRAQGEGRPRGEVGAGARHAGGDRARGQLSGRPALGRRLHPPDLPRQSPRGDHLRAPQARGVRGPARVPARREGTASRDRRDHAPSLRRGARRAHAGVPRHALAQRARLSDERLLPGLRPHCRRDLRQGEGAGHAPPLGGRSRRGRAPAHRDPEDEDHGAAHGLHRAHRRGSDPEGARGRGEGGVLRRHHPAARRLPRQSLPGGGGARLRRRPLRRRLGDRVPLRQPRPPAVPAGGLRDHQGGHLDGLEVLRHAAAARRAPRWGPRW